MKQINLFHSECFLNMELSRNKIREGTSRKNLTREVSHFYENIIFHGFAEQTDNSGLKNKAKINGIIFL